MRVLVRRLSGDTVSLSVGSAWSVGQLKRELAHTTGIPADQSVLVAGGQTLQDAQRLSDYGIAPDAHIMHVSRLRGGGPYSLRVSSSGDEAEANATPPVVDLDAFSGPGIFDLPLESGKGMFQGVTDKCLPSYDSPLPAMPPAAKELLMNVDVQIAVTGSVASFAMRSSDTVADLVRMICERQGRTGNVVQGLQLVHAGQTLRNMSATLAEANIAPNSLVQSIMRLHGG